MSISGHLRFNKKKNGHFRSSRNGNLASSKKVLELTNLEKTRSDLQKEVLTALFNASEEPEEESPRRIVPRRKQFGAYGQLVSEPFKDVDAEREKRVEYNDQIDLDGNIGIIFLTSIYGVLEAWALSVNSDENRLAMPIFILSELLIFNILLFKISNNWSFFLTISLIV